MTSLPKSIDQIHGSRKRLLVIATTWRLAKAAGAARSRDVIRSEQRRGLQVAVRRAAVADSDRVHLDHVPDRLQREPPGQAPRGPGAPRRLSWPPIHHSPHLLLR